MLYFGKFLNPNPVIEIFTLVIGVILYMRLLIGCLLVIY